METIKVKCKCGEEVEVWGLVEVCPRCKEIVCTDEDEEKRLTEIIKRYFRSSFQGD